jgi:predicted enzyme related to lactoylglutathione lyase
LLRWKAKEQLHHYTTPPLLTRTLNPMSLPTQQPAGDTVLSVDLLGLRTVLYGAPDLKLLTSWYTRFLGVAPYFEQPFYVGFNVGGYELGLDPNAEVSVGGSVTYWGVASIDVAWARALAAGALAGDPITEVGAGIKTATVRDPAGNVIGLIENPHFSL